MAFSASAGAGDLALEKGMNDEIECNVELRGSEGNLLVSGYDVATSGHGCIVSVKQESVDEKGNESLKLDFMLSVQKSAIHEGLYRVIADFKRRTGSSEFEGFDLDQYRVTSIDQHVRLDQNALEVFSTYDDGGTISVNLSVPERREVVAIGF